MCEVDSNEILAEPMKKNWKGNDEHLPDLAQQTEIIQHQ